MIEKCSNPCVMKSKDGYCLMSSCLNLAYNGNAGIAPIRGGSGSPIIFKQSIEENPHEDIPMKYGQWILCNEQLPDKKGYYLTSDRFGVTITQWNGRGWIRTSVVTITEYGRSVHHEPPIIAWMPLPKPYGR